VAFRFGHDVQVNQCITLILQRGGGHLPCEPDGVVCANSVVAVADDQPHGSTRKVVSTTLQCELHRQRVVLRPAEFGQRAKVGH